MIDKPTILIVDDEERTKKVLRINLIDNYDVLLANDGQQAVYMLKKNKVNLILSDLKMPKMTGIELLEYVKSNFPQIPFIIITAFGTVENAVDAMKLGALDYILKPVNIDELEKTIEKSLNIGRLIEENINLKQKLSIYENQNKIIYADKKIRDILETIKQVAQTPVSVLIEGESGTGKSFFAKAIHALSDRADKPFIEINCGAIPHELLESELFGHEKGSFTGAIKMKQGKFELADTGTLFLDEIGELPLDLQVKLLHVVENQKFTRVGGTQFITTNVRIISATNKVLHDEIEKKNFRQDLYYRLKVVYLKIPPLRERTDDIPVLVKYFLQKYSNLNKNKNIQISKETMDIFKAYKWHGNIRELENVIQQSIILCKNGIITEEIIPSEISENFVFENEKIPLTKIELQEYKNLKTKNILDNIEYRFLTNILNKTEGNITKAAEITGYDRRQIQNLIKKHNINTESFKK